MLEDEIAHSLAAVHSVSKGLEILSAKLDHLCEFIVNKDNEKRWGKWGSSEEIKQGSGNVREISVHALSVVEKMRSYRAYSGNLDLNLYISLLSASVKEEWRYTQIDQTSKVLFIGAGAFPLSAFTIARNTSAEVICTDIDDEAVYQGRKLTEFLGLQRSVHYLDSHLKASEAAGACTHVFIASLVPEKIEIVEELKTAVHPDCKMIIRYGNGLKSLFNYPLFTDLSSDWKVDWQEDWQVDCINRPACLYDTLILSLPKSALAAAAAREMMASRRS
ncbi:nicotianamine synthase family protein [Paenibacillus eucommiae]|nr:nicotianamine synthase family protein [Paenibacillus eucommiae]